MIIVLNEHGASGKTIGEIQSLCLKRNVNMMICFDIEEVKELINDISLLWSETSIMPIIDYDTIIGLI